MELIIIDDENLVLEGLKTLIQRYNSLIKVTCFNDVDSAFFYVQTNKPDIVISDIQMPKLNGLELCEKIKELCSAEIIIISGFENFNYAKKAVELGVLNYVLKPIDQKEFIKVLQNAILRINKKKTAENKKNKIIKSKILSDIANGFNNINLIKEELANANEEQNFGNYTVAIMVLDDSCFIPSFQNNEEFFNLYKRLYKTMNGIINKSSLSVSFAEAQPGKFVFLCMDYPDKCLKLLSLITKRLKEHLNIGTTVGVSSSNSGTDNLIDAYNEALIAIQREFFEGSNSIYSYNSDIISSIISKPEDKQYTFNLTKLNYYQNIFSSHIINEKNQMQLKQDTIILFDDMKSFCENNQEACRFCEELLLLIISIMFKSLEHNSLSANDIIKFCSTIKLKDIKTLADLKFSFLKTLEDLTAIVFSKILYKSNTIILKLNELLTEDCSSVSLQSAADAMGLNPTYFSILFKEKSGKNFKSYITEYKINYAKNLLLNPKIKIHEICEKLGWRDSNYFSKVFKKHTGLVPTNYRNKYLKGEGNRTPVPNQHKPD